MRRRRLCVCVYGYRTEVLDTTGTEVSQKFCSHGCNGSPPSHTMCVWLRRARPEGDSRGPSGAPVLTGAFDGPF